MSNTSDRPFSKTEQFYDLVISNVSKAISDRFLKKGIPSVIIDEIRKRWKDKLDSYGVYGQRCSRMQNFNQLYYREDGMNNQWNDRSDRTLSNPMMYSMPQIQMPQHSPINIGYGYLPQPHPIPHFPIGNPYSMPNHPSQQIIPNMPNMNAQIPNLNIHWMQLNKKNIKRNSEFDSNYKNDGNGTDSNEEENEDSESDPDAALFMNKDKKYNPSIMTNISSHSGSSKQSPNSAQIKNSPTKLTKNVKEESAVKKEKYIKSEEKNRKNSDYEYEFSATDHDYTSSINIMFDRNKDISKTELRPQQQLRTGSLLDPKPIRPKSEEIKNSIKNDDGDSSCLDSVTVSDEELSTDNLMVGQYIEVKSSKKWFRWEFTDVVLHVDDTDYIMKNVNVEISIQHWIN